MSDQLFTLTIKQVDYQNLYHCITSKVLLHCRPGYANQYLSGKCRIVYFHMKLKQLVLYFFGHTFAGELHSVDSFHCNCMAHAHAPGSKLV